MRLEEMHPFVRQALVGNLNKSNTYDVRTCIQTMDCRLFYIIAGGGHMRVEDKVYPLMPGTVILFPAGTPYVWEIETVKYYAVNFDYTHTFSHIRQTFHPIHSTLFSEQQIIERPQFEDAVCLHAPIFLPAAPMLAQTMHQITTEYCLGGAYTDMLLSALLKSAILTVLRMRENKEAQTEHTAAPLVREIIAYINLHYESAVTNETIAEKFHFNSVYLNRLFKAQTGLGMHAFLLNRRLTAAMEMLRSQNLPVAQVAEKCGFESLPHFSKTFKKRTGQTPSAYRELHI